MGQLLRHLSLSPQWLRQQSALCWKRASQFPNVCTSNSGPANKTTSDTKAANNIATYALAVVSPYSVSSMLSYCSLVSKATSHCTRLGPPHVEKHTHGLMKLMFFKCGYPKVWVANKSTMLLTVYKCHGCPCVTTVRDSTLQSKRCTVKS